MPDIFSKEKRTQIMSKIRGRDTGIEKTILAGLKSTGIRGFKYQKKMLGNPDFVFEKQKVAVFCDGDFWHGYDFKRWSSKLNKFWFDKITNNMRRDKIVSRKLKAHGWVVIRFWGHTIEKSPNVCIMRIKSKIGD